MSSKKLKTNEVHAIGLSTFFCCIKRESVWMFLENTLMKQKIIQNKRIE